MSLQTSVWRIEGIIPKPVHPSPMDLEGRLEDLIVADTDLLGPDQLLVIDQQVLTSHGKRLDVLAVGEEARLHAVELKKDKTPGDVVAQALDYGWWVRNLTLDDVREIWRTRKVEDGTAAEDVTFDEAYETRFQTAVEQESFNQQLDGDRIVGCRARSPGRHASSHETTSRQPQAPHSSQPGPGAVRPLPRSPPAGLSVGLEPPRDLPRRSGVGRPAGSDRGRVQRRPSPPRPIPRRSRGRQHSRRRQQPARDQRPMSAATAAAGSSGLPAGSEKCSVRVTALPYGRSRLEGEAPPYLRAREVTDPTVVHAGLMTGDDLARRSADGTTDVVAEDVAAAHLGDVDAWVDALVPAVPDAEMSKLLDLELRDGQVRFQPGPLDQALLGATGWFLRRRTAQDHDQALIIQLPRGRHDVAMLLGFAVQALRLHAASQPHRRGSPEAFPGSVLVSAMDTGVQARLADITIPGAGLEGLVEALHVFRLRADGRLVTPQRTTVPYRSGRPRMLYHNTRVGWPKLKGETGGVGVIDRTSIRNPDTFDRAVDWSQGHGVHRWIIVAELGDHEVGARLESRGISTVSLPVVPETIAALQRSLGVDDRFTPLSTNAVASQPRPSVHVEHVDAPELDQLLRRCYGMLAQARKVDPELPHQVVSVARLLAGISRCADRLLSYNQAAVDDRSAQSLRTTANVLTRRGEELHGGRKWHSYGQTTWARLRDDALRAYTLLEEQEPKYHQLVNAIDSQLRDAPSARIRVRTSSRASARGLVATLTHEHPTWLENDLVSVLPWSAVLPWTTEPVTEILVAPPPRYRNGLLFSGESTKRVILAYASEVPLIRAAFETETSKNEADLADFCRCLHLDSSPPVTALCVPERAPHIPAAAGTAQDVGVDIDRALEGARLLADVEEDDDTSMVVGRTSGLASMFGEKTALLPVSLSSGLTWWLSPDAPVEALIGEKYHHRLASQLRPGDQVIVPRGDGREALFSRLVAAAHRGADVAELDMLLGRFRRACHEAYRLAGENWAELNRRLDASGCSATTQARAWADGSTIAPADPEDVRRVALLAEDPVLAEGWRGVASIAHELRSLHQRVGHLISGAMVDLSRGGGPSLTAIEDLLGDRAEVLDEFVVETITSIGAEQMRDQSDSGTML